MASEVEDARVVSHDCPFCSALVVAMVDAVCTSQSDPDADFDREDAVRALGRDVKDFEDCRGKG